MQENSSAHIRLDSWKEIADYLKRDVRTAIRWGKARGLPVHRVPGGKRQAVFAYPKEIDAWLEHGEHVATQCAQRTTNGAGLVAAASALELQPEAASVQQARSRKYFAVAPAIGLVAVVLLWVGFTSHRAPLNPPFRIDFTANAIQALDAQGRLIWTHSFPKPLSPEYLKHVEKLTDLVRIVDLNGDNEPEVLVTIPLSLGPNPNDRVEMELDCFSSGGKLLWSYVAQERFRFGNYELQGPWYLFDIVVSSQGPKPAIWATFAHYEWGNSFIVQLDPSTGKGNVRFVNTGLLYRLSELRSSAGTYLLAAGFNNEYAAGSLAVIDESKAFAVSPQTQGTRHKCVSCGDGAPDYYFVFPKSEINLQRNAWENSIKYIIITGQDFEISKMELGNIGAEGNGAVRSIYLFHTQPTIQPFAFRFDSSYDMLHRELEKDGKLGHTLESCPERLHPKPIRVWTASVGWKEINLNPVRFVD